MAMGKTVISTNVDGIPELLKEGRGLVVEPNNEDELVQKIISCITDCDLLHDMEEKSITYMQEYPTWDEVSMKMANEIVGSLSNEMAKGVTA